MKKKIFSACISLLSLSLTSALFFSCKDKEILVSTRNFSEKLEYIDISADYPQIESNPSLTEQITSYIDKQMELYKKDSKEFWEEIVMQQDEDYSPYLQCSYEETFEVTQARKYLSITTCEYVYLGGAHGSIVFKTYTINKKTGKNVSLTELTGMNYEEISKACREQLIDTLITNNEDDIHDSEDKTWLLEYIEAGTEPEDERFSVYAVSNDKVIVIFNQYEVAPYVYGFQTVELPLKNK